MMRVDENGNAWWEWLVAGFLVAVCIVGAVVTGGATSLVGAVLIGAAIGGGLSMVSQGITAIQTGSSDFSWGQFALDMGVGAITGAIGVSGISRPVATALGGIIGGVSSIRSQLIEQKGSWSKIDWWKVGISAAIGALASFAGGAGNRNVKAQMNRQECQKR